MTTNNIVAWIVIGLIAGIVTVFLRRSDTFAGMIVDLVLGIFGGFLGGAAVYGLGGLVGAEIIGVNLGGAVVSVVGATIVLVLWEALRGERNL